MRSISSFISFPGRPNLRFASRALDFLRRNCWEGFTFTNLSTAPVECKQDIASLVTPAVMPFTCSFCKCSVHHPTCYIGDAGQAYETVDMETVVNATRSLIKEAGQKGLADGIQVKKCRSPEVSFGGSIRTAFLDRLVFTRASLAQFACTCLLFRTVRLACLFATQISGIPTGHHSAGSFWT